MIAYSGRFGFPMLDSSSVISDYASDLFLHRAPLGSEDSEVRHSRGILLKTNFNPVDRSDRGDLGSLAGKSA